MTNKTTIVVTGSTGQLGQSIRSIAKQYPQYRFIFTNRNELDLAHTVSISRYFEQQSCDVIINCAAHTAVDKAETEVDLADQINHLAVKQISQIAQQLKAKLIHISTDYVFDGKGHRPYQEEDTVDPQGVYGETKLNGEQAVLKQLKHNALIIRTSWVYSEFGKNFVKTMLRLGQERDNLNVIFDQVGTPTYARDLASAIMSIIEHSAFKRDDFETNVLHFSNEGVASWYDFAQTIFEMSNINCSVSPIETKDYPTPATRPHYSVLNKAKIKATYGLSIPYWKNSLHHCLTMMPTEND